MKQIISTTLLSFLSIILFAQENAALTPNDSASLLRQNGQIYLVVLVLLTIFAGIILMLVRLEKKLTKLEKN